VSIDGVDVAEGGRFELPRVEAADPRRNGGGRPQGLARLAREAVGDGQDLIQFFTAVFRADRKALGERRIALRDRMQAATWLADRAFGRAVQVVEVPEDPQQGPIRPHGVRAWLPCQPRWSPSSFTEFEGSATLLQRFGDLLNQRSSPEDPLPVLAPGEPGSYRCPP
jgi:hypothetical protein